MALFAAIGDRFIAKIIKQIASDYNLDFEEMKSRYCGDTSFELSISTKELKKNQLTVDLEVPAPVMAVKIPKPKAPKAVDPDAPPKAPKVPKPTKVPDEPKGPAPMALSKMKKPDLVAECEERGLDSEGTVAQLKERVKDARAALGEKKPARKKAEPKPKAAPPPPPPVPLEEEDGEEDEEEFPDIKKLRDELEEEEEEEEEHDDLQARLRKILAEAEEDEFEDEDEDDQEELEELVEEELED